METKNIIIVGVGGQGSLLASKILGDLLLREGYDVKVSEVHGMSQRGGSVITYVRFGDRVYSPGQIVTNTQQIDPMPVITGAAEYPEDLVEKIKAKGVKLDAMDCLSLAREAGSVKAVNIVLLGRLSHYFDIPEEKWQAVLTDNVPPKFLEINRKAFELGRNYQG